MSALPDAVPEIDAQAAYGLLGTSLFLDVREEDEWSAGHIDGAIHIRLGELPQRYTALPKDHPIVCVCRVGGRSAHATAALRGAGYDVTNLAGGMHAWADAGLPFAAADGSAGRVV